MPGPERSRGLGRRLIGALFLPPLLACASNTAPAHFLPAPVQSQRESFGGWIELEVTDSGTRQHRVEGELLAVSATDVWVLGDSGAVVVPTGMVKAGQLTGYRSSAGAISGYSALGTLSTISNGVFLIFTAPMWIIGGSLAAGAESGQPVRKVPPLEWPQLDAWARFPQGMPEGLDPGILRPKPRQP
jgi:hypothetical protein